MSGKGIKITYVLPVYWPAVGGCELHTHELVNRLSKKYDIKVITFIDNQKDKLCHELWVACILRAPSNLIEYKDSKTRVLKIPLTPIEKLITLFLVRTQSPKFPNLFVNFVMEVLSDFFRNKLIRLAEGCDIMHCVHGGVSYLGYAALKAARRLGIPFVYTPVLHLYQDNSRKRKHVYKPRLCLSPRGWTDNFWNKLCFASDALITMTEFERRFFIARGISTEKAFHVGVGPIIANKGDPRKFRENYNVAENNNIILFLGRNHEAKGIDSLLGAAPIVWKKFPDTYFFFVGPQEGKSLQIFDKYIDNRIIKTGNVTLSEKTSALEACDVLCIPSLEESFGGAFLEAWSFKKPVIGADIPPVRELLEGGKGGYLVKSYPEDIARKIIKLLECEALRNKMGNHGWKKVENNYSWRIISTKIEDVYKKCLDYNA
jgi:glycosyltransferase involved in cell wall biosynthesis